MTGKSEVVVGEKPFPSGTLSFTPQPKPGVSSEVGFFPQTLYRGQFGTNENTFFVFCVLGDFREVI